MPNMTTKRRKPRRRTRRSMGAASPPLVELYSTFASQRKCATAISGYGDLKAHGDNEGAAHVYQDIMRFCVDPRDRK